MPQRAIPPGSGAVHVPFHRIWPGCAEASRCSGSLDILNRWEGRACCNSGDTAYPWLFHSTLPTGDLNAILRPAQARGPSGRVAHAQRERYFLFVFALDWSTDLRSRIHQAKNASTM